MKYNEKHELLNKGRELEKLLEDLNACGLTQSMINDIFDKLEFNKNYNDRVFILNNKGEDLHSNIDDVIYEMKSTILNLADIISYQDDKIKCLTKIINTLLNGIVKNKEGE